jgi:hypothetical protein
LPIGVRHELGVLAGDVAREADAEETVDDQREIPFRG